MTQFTAEHTVLRHTETTNYFVFYPLSCIITVLALLSQHTNMRFLVINASAIGRVVYVCDWESGICLHKISYKNVVGVLVFPTGHNNYNQIETLTLMFSYATTHLLMWSVPRIFILHLQQSID